MNRSVLGRVLSVLLAFYVLAFCAFLLYSLLAFSPHTALPIFRWQHSLRNALLLFIDFLIPIHVSGVAVGFSLAGGGGARTSAEPGRAFSRIISSSLVAFIFLTAVYTVLSIGVAPITRRGMTDLEYQSSLARQFLALAERAQKNGSFAEAKGYADLYLDIDRNNMSVLEMEQNLQQKTAKQKTTTVVLPPNPVQPPEGLDAGGLLAKARFYYDQKDYFSANYYAAFAAKLEPGRADAQKLAAQAWEMIQGTPESLSKEDVNAADLYRKKTAAYKTLSSGDSIGAYYSFLQLSAQYPKDPDIAKYLAQSRAEVTQAAFFMDDAAHAIPLPGTQNILFINRNDKGITEVVFIGKLVETIEAAYALDVEAIQYRADGSVVWHLSAQYGRLSGQTLIMQGLDRSNPKIRSMPVYIQGTRPRAELALLTLTPSVEQMKAMSTDRAGVSLIGLADLWKMRTSLGALGASGREISMQILMDVLMPFIFLTLSFIAAAFGWGFRARYLSRPPIALFFLVPVVPLVASMASLLWIYAHRVLMGFMVLAAGFVPALVLCAAVELVILVASLVLLAGQGAS